MADKSQSARGPQSKTFNLRAEVGKLEWGGMNPDADPGGLPPNQFHRLINTRFTRGGLVPRGGQIKVNASALHDAAACIPGLFDFQMGTKRSLVVAGQGCPGLSNTQGFNVGTYDTEQSPKWAPVIYYDTTSVSIAIGTYGGDLYIGSDNVLRKFQRIAAPYGTPPLDVSGVNQDIPILTFAGYTSITFLCECFGLLFIGLATGAGGGKIVTWDGTTILNDEISENKPPTFMMPWQDKLIVGYAAAANKIKVRDSAGTYTNVAPGAGTVAAVRGVSYYDNAYLTDGGINVWKYDGATLAVTHSFSASSVTKGITRFPDNNLLYVLYKDGTTSHVRIAKLDGATGTWTDAEKDLTAQHAVATTAYDLSIYRGNLVAAAADTTGGSLYISVGTATSGSYTKVQPNIVLYNGGIQQLVLL